MSSSSPNNSPRFSVISAVYNVSRYLPDFIASIERQTYGTTDGIEVIMVDDGSDDDSLAVLNEWSGRRPGLVKVLSKENGGQASARNLAIEHATGEWLTFIDPDDWVIDSYFQTVADFIDLDPRVRMVACHRVFYEEPENRLRDGHPLRSLFKQDQLVNLDRRPEFFHGSAPSAFVLRDVVVEHGLRFDVHIRPNFEDGHFCARYLLACDEPQVGFLRSAEYVYRKRGDGSSTLQQSTAQTGRYDEVPRLGYLDVLRRADDQFGNVPLWLQYFILYELSWYFSSDEKPNNNLSACTGEIGRRFVELLAEISEYLDDGAIESYRIRRFKHEWRCVLLHSVRKHTWHTPFVVLQQFDETKKLVRIAYRYVGEPPTERITLSGRERHPYAAKVRSHHYFGQPLLQERTIWIPLDGTLRVELDGELVELRGRWPGATVVSMSRAQIADKFVKPRLPGIRTRLRHGLRAMTDGLDRALRSPTHLIERLKGDRPQTAGDDTPRPPGGPTRSSAGIVGWVRKRIVLQLAVTQWARSRYKDAWVLMDRIHDANDSGEALFHHLRDSHPDVNAWFTVEEGTADWDRLMADGCDRLVPYGGLRWKLMMLNCAVLVSSHVDVPIHRPPAFLELGPPRWRFVFLQHGVIKDDLSRWLNTKKIDLFVTSTPAEYRSIAGDGSPYALTPREVKLTGLPRFDALEQAKRRLTTAERRLVLLTPTWRQWLNEPLAPGSQRRTVVEAFDQTEFAERWSALISSERLRAIADTYGCTVGLLPHPNLRSAGFDDAPSIEHFEFSSPDLHDVFGRTIVNISDFSSMAFNVAYLGQPTIYYQFDRDRVLGGAHVGRAGYFSYDDDGFGPVVFEHDDVLDALEKLLAAGGDPGLQFRQRIDDTFPFRDGHCSERVANEIKAMLSRTRTPIEPALASVATV